MAVVGVFSRWRARRVRWAVGRYLVELQREMLDPLDQRLLVGVVLADVLRVAGAEPLPEIAAWLDDLPPVQLVQ